MNHVIKWSLKGKGMNLVLALLAVKYIWAIEAQMALEWIFPLFLTSFWVSQIPFSSGLPSSMV